MSAPFLNDFPDRISPMLVKELRQGMRARTFVGVFLSLQIVLAIILLSASAAGSSSDAGDTISKILFIFFGIVVLIIQPMRGMTALSSEIKGNTIDMMVLTRLSAWRIVLGKWASMVSQTALLLVTILPYLILRYFFGGMELVAEIVFLSAMFIASITLTAITIGLSASPSIILRSILPMTTLPIGSYIMTMIFLFSGGDFTSTFSLSTPESRGIMAIFLVFCSYYGYFSLSAGSSMIAPYAENHATQRRLIALAGVILSSVICCSSFTSYKVIPWIQSLVLLPIIGLSVSEFAPLAPPTYAKFLKHGILGRGAGFFLFPGWSSGLFSSFLLILISVIPFALNNDASSDLSYRICGICLLASLAFPALLIQIFSINGTQRLASYLLFLIGSVIFASIIAGIADALSNNEILWFICWIPPVLLFINESGRNDDALLGVSIIINAIIWSILVIRALRDYVQHISEIKKNTSTQ